MMEMKDNFSIQFISHTAPELSYLEGIRKALEGGCKWIQLRMKDASDEEFMSVAIQARRLCSEAGATFILDDRVGMVEKCGADGVHLGKNDMSPDKAREILGRGKIIGGTANTLEDIISLYEKGVDYIGCGPFRFTTTKQNLSPVLGLEGYREIVRGMKDKGIDLPIVAIGGICNEDIAPIMQTGVDGIALSGSILRADNPSEEMKRTIIEVKKWKN